LVIPILMIAKVSGSWSTICGKTFEWENFFGFQDFLLNCKYIPANYKLQTTTGKLRTFRHVKYTFKYESYLDLPFIYALQSPGCE